MTLPIAPQTKENGFFPPGLTNLKSDLRRSGVKPNSPFLEAGIVAKLTIVVPMMVFR